MIILYLALAAVAAVCFTFVYRAFKSAEAVFSMKDDILGRSKK